MTSGNLNILNSKIWFLEDGKSLNKKAEKKNNKKAFFLVSQVHSLRLAKM